MNAFTIWTKPLTTWLSLATAQSGTTFGIWQCSTIFFRFSDDRLILHMDNGNDIKAVMERRNS